MAIRITIIKTRPSIDINWFNVGIAEQLDMHSGSVSLLSNRSRTMSEDELTMTVIEEYNSIEDFLNYDIPTLADLEWTETHVYPYPATVGITISKSYINTETNYEYTQEEINSLVNNHVGRT